MVNIAKMDDSLMENLLNFKEEKILIYGKDGETIGTLNISLQYFKCLIFSSIILNFYKGKQLL